jgi:hypothetical protein
MSIKNKAAPLSSIRNRHGTMRTPRDGSALPAPRQPQNTENARKNTAKAAVVGRFTGGRGAGGGARHDRADSIFKRVFTRRFCMLR